MSVAAQIVHIDDAAPEAMARGNGWSITDFRLPLSARQGLKTTCFRARFEPGAVHKKHRHDACDEIYYVISGTGAAGCGNAVGDIRSGHFHYVPHSHPHWLANSAGDHAIEVVGWYIGAGSVAETGYAYLGEVTDADLAAPRGAFEAGALRHIGDATPVQAGTAAKIDISDIRLGIGPAQGSAHAAWRTVFAPGDASRRHLHETADELYYVIEGEARLAAGDDFHIIRAGHAVFIPAGMPHEVANISKDEPFLAVGIYDGAADFEAAGTVFLS